VIEDDQIGSVRRDLGSHFLDLALAGIGRRIRAVTTSLHHGTNDRARRPCQQADLFKLLGKVFTTEVELDDDRTLLGGRALSHADDLREAGASRSRQRVAEEGA
jgi:hypothetical protein